MVGYCYLLFNQRNGTLYVGVTNDLIRRVYGHKEKLIVGFTKKYGVDKIGYFEIYDAIEREKTIKNYSRKKKIKLIESANSH
ncbi:nuclease [Alphaproteobacteria bacterium]|nr:nuclease [Alphaproteobacteria bacterium]